jgi:hypothetical protein
MNAATKGDGTMTEIDSTLFEEGLGFPGVCSAPCFSVLVESEAWGPDDPANPLPLPGNSTYVYTLTHEGGEGDFIPAVFEFEISADSDFITDAGSIEGAGVEPSTVTIQEDIDVVSWGFTPDLVSSSEFTQPLFVHSPLEAGYVEASLSGQASLTAIGETVGPVPEPATSLLAFAAIITVALCRRVRRAL